MPHLAILILFGSLIAEAFAQPGPDGTWITIGPPPVRSSHSAIYDSPRDRMIVFGGFGGGGVRRNDVWELSLPTAVWQQLLPAGAPPSARSSHTAIFDPVQNRMLVFGGFDGVRRNDLWQLSFSGSGQAWESITPSGAPPSARSGHSAIYDPVRLRMIVFGGTNGTVSNNETWELSLAGSPTWTQMSPVGPLPGSRSGHSAVYDPVGDRMLVFGGSDGSNAVWELTLGGTPAWSVITTQGTPAPWRRLHAAIYDPDSERMLIFGGLSGTDLADTWELTLDGAPTWNAVTASGFPGARSSHAAIHDPVRRRMLIFGGRNSEFVPATELNDVRELSLAGPPGWTSPVATGPPPHVRDSHSQVLDSSRQRMLVFGGADAGQVFNDVSALSLIGAQVWGPVAASGTPPAPRGEHAAVYDPVRDRMLVFGGWNFGPSIYSDSWALSLGDAPAWAPLAASGTPMNASRGHSAVYDASRDRVLIFGGFDGSQPHNDVWELSLGGGPNWTLMAPQGPPPPERFWHTAIYDSPRDRMIVFGGARVGGIMLTDLWELTLAGTPTWNPINPAGSAPIAGQNASAIFDAGRDRMVVFGGYYFDGAHNRTNGTWALDLLGPPAWTQLAPTGTLPMGRERHGAIYDPPRDRMVVFGGYGANTGRLNDAPVLLWDATVGVAHPPLRGGSLTVRAYPVPFREGTDFAFDLPRAMHVSLGLYDVVGRPVKSLIEGPRDPGTQRVRWDGKTATGSTAPAGVYLYRLRTSMSSATGRIVKLK